MSVLLSVVCLQANLEKMRDEVLVAERAVLYAISFQLRIKVPYNDLLLLQQHLPEAHRHDVINVAWNLVNDRWGAAAAGTWLGSSRHAGLRQQRP